MRFCFFIAAVAVLFLVPARSWGQGASGVLSGPEFSAVQAFPIASGARIFGADLVALPEGWIVVWSEETEGKGRLRAQRFGVAGEMGDVVQISQDDEDAFEPRLWFDGQTLWCVWTSDRADRDGYGIVARGYLGADLAKAGPRRVVNHREVGGQWQPSLASRGPKGLVVVYSSLEHDESGFGIAARMLDVEGLATGREFLVNHRLEESQTRPAAAGCPDGSFVVVWESQEDSGVIGARLFDGDGQSSGEDLDVSGTLSGPHGRPLALCGEDGAFLFWERGPSGRGTLMGRALGRDGAVGKRGFAVTPSGLVAGTSDVVAVPDGFLVIWSESGELPALRIRRYWNRGAPAGESILLSKEPGHLVSVRAVRHDDVVAVAVVRVLDGSGSLVLLRMPVPQPL